MRDISRNQYVLLATNSVRLGLVLATSLLAACGPKALLIVDQAKNADTAFLVDATGADSYPSFLAGEGSILSCRYGIHFYATDEFVPRKGQLFAGTLAEAVPAIAGHKVKLERFDVYYNYQLRLGKFAAEMADGQVLRELARGPDGNGTGTAGLILEQDPVAARAGNVEEVFGCAAAGEGEYAASQGLAGHDVVVTWLTFRVDGKPYRFRSFHTFKFDKKAGKEGEVRSAVESTIREAARRLDLQAG